MRDLRCFSIAFILSLCPLGELLANSMPFAIGNRQGDQLALQEKKGLIFHGWFSEKTKTAALRWRLSSTYPIRLSGGLADRNLWLPQLPSAIACSDQEIALFDPKASPRNPTGSWRFITGAKATDRSSDAPLLCAMQRHGHFAWIDAKQSALVIDQSHKIPLPEPADRLELLADGQDFLLLFPSGSSYLISEKNSDWTIGAPRQHPWSGYQENTRFASNGEQVLRADSEGVWLATRMNKVWGSQRRLPINPCAEASVCGLSMAEDESWLVSGYWGHYLGRGSQFTRLDKPILGKKDDAVAMSHQGMGGAYVYLGSDDADRGVLPVSLGNARETGETLGQRWVVWGSSDLTLSGGFSKEIGKIALDRRTRTRTLEDRDADQLSLFVWNGPLPESIPSSWVAWEREKIWQAADPVATEFSIDSNFEKAWWRQEMRIVPIHEMAQAAHVIPTEVHAAVIDSGIDPLHPWLIDQRAINSGEIPDNGIDDDGNDFVDDVWGYDFVEEDGLPQDKFGHGTHVAGLMMASHAGVSGIAPNLRLTVVRALDRYGKSNSIDLARAIYYSLDRGVELINCSWGGGAESQALRDAFASAFRAGVPVIASAGNDHLDTDQFPEVPKRYPGVVSVGAYTSKGNLAKFSNFGKKSVHWLMPGEEIDSTLLGQSFGSMSGTSMAAPLASSSFAWIYGLRRSLFPDEEPRLSRNISIKILCQSADAEKFQGKSSCGQLRIEEASREILEKKSE